jgi:hypothetical protein
MTEFQKLQARWEAKTGTPMPIEIGTMTLEKIRKAVALVEAGAVVGCHTQKPPSVETQESSLQDWDRQDDKNGNAYA